MVARGLQEGPVVGDDQAGVPKPAKEALEEDLCSQVQEIRGLIEEEKVRFMEEEGRQFDPGEPPSGKGIHRPFKERPLDFELACHFTGAPFRLAAVPHEKVEYPLSGEKWILLAEIPRTEAGVGYHPAGVEVLLVGEDAKERGLPGPVPSDEAHLDACVQGERRVVEENLFPVSFKGVLDLEQGGHGENPATAPG
jgi:hypothetical protein